MGFDASLGAFDISASGMSAERFRMEIVANNIANASVTRTPEGGAYRRKEVVFEAAMKSAAANSCGNDQSGFAGVRVVEVIDDRSEMPRVLNPCSYPHSYKVFRCLFAVVVASDSLGGLGLRVLSGFLS